MGRRTERLKTVEARRNVDTRELMFVEQAVVYGTISVTSFDTPLVPQAFLARSRTK